MLFWLKKIRVFILCIFVLIEILFFIHQVFTRQKYIIKTDSEHMFITNAEKPVPLNKSVDHVNYSIPGVDDFVQLFQSKHRGNVNILGLAADEPYANFLKRLNKLKKKGAMLNAYPEGNVNSSRGRFVRGISQFHNPSDEYLIQDLLHDLHTLPIVHSAPERKGTQLKLKVTFSDGTTGFFKPERIPKNVDSSPDRFYFTEYERFTAEIAAFHIDRLLGFHRGYPVVGRLMNITKDLASYISDKNAVEFVYTSPGGNLCFVGKCKQKCGRYNPFCGDGLILQGSVSVSLPLKNTKLKRHPYVKSFSITKKAVWEKNEKYCEIVKKNVSLYEMLELVDIAVFDFFTDNLDRHSYRVFTTMKQPVFIIAFDNGKGFNRAKVDSISNLAPLLQCCQIRLSTLAKLIKLFRGPDSFSQVTRASLNSDPLSPILTEAHLEALDRRLGKVIKVVSGCINNGRSWEDVVIDDLIVQSNLNA